MIPADWIEHRRSSDREIVGYVAPTGDLVVAMSLLGTPLGEPGDWHDAEECLDQIGLSQLAEPWWLSHDGGPDQKVAIVEVDREHVVVANADFALVIGVPRDIGDRQQIAVPTDRLRPA
ncbi:hypothetical protein [Aeromicrobium sp. CF3.5]|uniref:hypothetical protein n=1 Tax=Aeromicrobium sp. CF3.5 TaxID=3373078 RepID=UPI003EE772F1